MTQEEYVQIIHNLDNSFKDNFVIRWHDGQGGKSEPIRGFTATHKINPNIHRVVDKDYVNHLNKEAQARSHKIYKQDYEKTFYVTTKVSSQQATLLRLKYGDTLRYFEQADSQVVVRWPRSVFLNEIS